MTSTVIIWNNNMVSSKLGMGFNTTGHACMNISNAWAVNQYVEDQAHWVSWWPGDASEGMRRGKAYGNFLKDLEKERYVPDHILQLTGLNESRMRTEWEAIRTKKDAHYRFNVKNCSTIVARVLRAGTAWSNQNIWYAHSCLWTPLKVKRFALDLGAKEVAWVDFCNELRSQGANSPQLKLDNVKRSDRHGNPDTPARFVGGRDTWKKAT